MDRKHQKNKRSRKRIFSALLTTVLIMITMSAGGPTLTVSAEEPDTEPALTVSAEEPDTEPALTVPAEEPDTGLAKMLNPRAGQTENSAASVTVDGITAYYDSLAEAWDAAEAESSETNPATLHLLKTTDIGTASLILERSDSNVIFTMTEGVILTGSPSRSIIQIKAGTLTLQNGTFTSTSAIVIDLRAGNLFLENGASVGGEFPLYGVYMDGADPNAKFTMNGGSISLSTNKKCFGVYISYGTFIMNDGTIDISSNNTGVCVNPTAQGFTMTGGHITGGYGVEIAGGTTSIMGGTITGTYTGGYGLSMQNGSLTVGGTAKIESAENGSNFAMNVSSNVGQNSNVEITGNAVIFGRTAGGLIASGEGTDITISGNAEITGSTGPGIQLWGANDAQIRISGGTIQGKGENSIGIYVLGGTLYMENGKVTGNGNIGIYVLGGTLSMEGGEVSSRSSYGICVWEYNGTHGNAYISGGKVSGLSGIYVGGSGILSLGGGTFNGGNNSSVINYRPGETVKDLLDTDCFYFKGTDASEESRISDTAALSRSLLSASAGYSTVTVAKVSLEITGHPEDQTITYGDQMPPTLTVEAEKTASVPDDRELIYQWYQDQTKLDGATGASYTLPQDLKPNIYHYFCIVSCDGYNISSNQAKVTVQPKEITVNADDQTCVYGECPTLTYTAPGLVGNDTLAEINLTCTSDGNVGRYPISISQGENANPNYDITFVPGTLTVEARDISDAEIILGNALIANGTLQTQEIRSVIVKNTDGREMEATYTVSGNQGTEAGTYTMTLTGTGNFTGTILKTFVIVPPIGNEPETNGEGAIVIGNGSIVLQVELEAGAPRIEVQTSQAALIDMLIAHGDLTADELAQTAEGAAIHVLLKVTVTAEDISAESKAQIQAATKGYTIGQYLDISLFKQITFNDTAGEWIPLTGTVGNITASLVVPDELWNTDSSVTRTFRIVRNHEGTVEFLPTTYDTASHTLTFETNKFSDYAIVYQDTTNGTEDPANPTNPTNPADPTNPANPTNPTGSANPAAAGSSSQTKDSFKTSSVAAVATGDSSDLLLWVTLLFGSLGGILMIIYQKRNS